MEIDFAEAPFAAASPMKAVSVVESEGKASKHPTFLLIVGDGPYVLHNAEDVMRLQICLP